MLQSTVHVEQNIFLKKLLQKLEVHIFTLLLAPFTPKLINYSRQSKSLNIWKNCEIAYIFLRWQRSICLIFKLIWKTQYAKKIWIICVQKVPKEAQRYWQPTSIRVFSKKTVGCQKFVHFIGMLCSLCSGRLSWVESVSLLQF